MLGRSPDRDRATGAPDKAGYDSQSKYFAAILYDDDVGFAYTHTRQNLHASNKPSEHNISNTLPRIVVAQLATPTQARGYKKTLSRTITLRPGNQSLGGT